MRMLDRILEIIITVLLFIVTVIQFAAFIKTRNLDKFLISFLLFEDTICHLREIIFEIEEDEFED